MKVTVVVFRKTETGPFEARVLQEHRMGPNLSPKTGNAQSAKSAAERKLRHEGWTGAIEFQEGTPEKTVLDLPISTSRDNYGIKGSHAYRNNTPKG
jgi:hypothetical protein